MSEGRLGVWCPQERRLRFLCFEVDRLQPFGLDEIASWFAPSAERVYSATAPLGEFEVSLDLPAGTYPQETPECFRSVDELLAPANYPAVEKNDPAFAIFVVYPQAALVEVLPQNWITRVNYDVATHWITRVVRDPESYRIVGELSRVGIFELAENGRDLGRWL
jgi:hypothetical protein